MANFSTQGDGLLIWQSACLLRQPSGVQYTEPEFENVYGAQELIPRNRFRQARYICWRNRFLGYLMFTNSGSDISQTYKMEDISKGQANTPARQKISTLSILKYKQTSMELESTPKQRGGPDKEQLELPVGGAGPKPVLQEAHRQAKVLHVPMPDHIYSPVQFHFLQSRSGKFQGCGSGSALN